MRWIALSLISVALVGCDSRRGGEQATGDELTAEQILEGNPGMKKECLGKDRWGGIGTDWMDNPDCYEMTPERRWSGLWKIGWEWSKFCAQPATECDANNAWLIFDKGAYPGPRVADGLYKITFIGRRSQSAGHFGHTSSYRHLMVVDRVISIERIPGETYTDRF